METLTTRVWNRLAEVDSLTFVSRSSASSSTGWVGEAAGKVAVRRESVDCILFAESGSWRTPEGRSFDFTNTYRWCRDGDSIRLEHLRFGADRPVYLFELIPDGVDRMTSRDPHVCSEDLYTANLQLADDILIAWTVVGPKLNERIEYCYRNKNQEANKTVVATAVNVLLSLRSGSSTSAVPHL